MSYRIGEHGKRGRELKTRQAQFFMQIHDSFHTTEFLDRFTDILTWHWDGYDDFMEKYRRKKNPEAWYSLGSVGAFFEGIDVLACRELIDVNLVADLMSRHTVFIWEKIQPISEEFRKRFQLPVDPRLEYLYNETKPIIGKQLAEVT